MTLDEGAAAVHARRPPRRRHRVGEPAADRAAQALDHVAEAAELGLGEEDRGALVGEPAHVRVWWSSARPPTARGSPGCR